MKKKIIRNIYNYISVMCVIGTFLYFFKGIYMISKGIYYILYTTLDNCIGDILTGLVNIIVASVLALLWLLLNSDWDRKE